MSTLFSFRRTTYALAGIGLGSIQVYALMHINLKNDSKQIKTELQKQRDIVYMLKLNEMKIRN